MAEQHDDHDDDAHPHTHRHTQPQGDERHHHPEPQDDGRRTSFTVHAPVDATSVERKPASAVWVFDEENVLLGTASVDNGMARLELSDRFAHRMVRVIHAPIDSEIPEPTLARLRRVGGVEQRVLLRPGIDLKIPVVDAKWWRRACCRVRGRVVVTVTLPDGRTIQRPLCSARVIICEVDTSLRAIIDRLPNDLLFRLRREWLNAVRLGTGVDVETNAAAGAIREGLRHVHREEAEAPLASLAALSAVEVAPSAAVLRSRILDHLDLLKPYWCVFGWLHRFYKVDCIKTAPLDEHGRFDADISYPCYGDHPDLYFKVEQDCHNTGWLTVHQPPVHCHTHWDYCCGKEVTIQVTHPDAVPGRALTPCTWPYVPTSPSSIGAWELLPAESGVFAVHAAVLHTGKVLLFSGTAERSLPKESRVWDPDIGTFTAQTFADDLFCAGHAMMADGRVLVNGGSSTPGTGIRATYIFDPAGETWTRMADMAFARWYPTTLTLPDGRILTFSGRPSGPPVAELEVYDPGADTWTTLPATANKAVDIYPSIHLMPDGRIFYTGTRWAGGHAWPSPPLTALFDPATSTWADVGAHVIPNRTEGFSVLLPPLPAPPEGHEHGDVPEPHVPPTLTRVLVVGGPGDMRSAEIIDFADPAPAWRRIADAHHPRINTNGVILPDGTVVFCTGIDGHKFGAHTGSLKADIFDHLTETWAQGAAMAVKRHYHSVSILLPDGRVLNTGSENLQMSMEVYSPPYLFRGPRPRITLAPLQVAYGSHFHVESPDSCRIDRAVFIRTSSITHHTNTDQRYLPLKAHEDGHCRIHITAPANARVAPPGYYMLFLLDDCGVPSIAKFIRVG
jgi:hypothetical protein